MNKTISLQSKIIIMKSIRSESTQKSRRRRECWHCGKGIQKGEVYRLREIRYDKTIMCMYYHIACTPKPLETYNL